MTRIIKKYYPTKKVEKDASTQTPDWMSTLRRNLSRRRGTFSPYSNPPPGPSVAPSFEARLTPGIHNTFEDLVAGMNLNLSSDALPGPHDRRYIAKSERQDEVIADLKRQLQIVQESERFKESHYEAEVESQNKRIADLKSQARMLQQQCLNGAYLKAKVESQDRIIAYLKQERLSLQEDLIRSNANLERKDEFIADLKFLIQTLRERFANQLDADAQLEASDRALVWKADPQRLEELRLAKKKVMQCDSDAEKLGVLYGRYTGTEKDLNCGKRQKVRQALDQEKSFEHAFSTNNAEKTAEARDTAGVSLGPQGAIADPFAPELAEARPKAILARKARVKLPETVATPRLAQAAFMPLNGTVKQGQLMAASPSSGYPYPACFPVNPRVTPISFAAEPEQKEASLQPDKLTKAGKAEPTLLNSTRAEVAESKSPENINVASADVAAAGDSNLTRARTQLRVPLVSTRLGPADPDVARLQRIDKAGETLLDKRDTCEQVAERTAELEALLERLGRMLDALEKILAANSVRREPENITNGLGADQKILDSEKSRAEPKHSEEALTKPNASSAPTATAIEGILTCSRARLGNALDSSTAGPTDSHVDPENEIIMMLRDRFVYQTKHITKLIRLSMRKPGTITSGADANERSLHAVRSRDEPKHSDVDSRRPDGMHPQAAAAIASRDARAQASIRLASASASKSGKHVESAEAKGSRTQKTETLRLDGLLLDHSLTREQILEKASMVANMLARGDSFKDIDKKLNGHMSKEESRRIRKDPRTIDESLKSEASEKELEATKDTSDLKGQPDVLDGSPSHAPSKQKEPLSSNDDSLSIDEQAHTDAIWASLDTIAKDLCTEIHGGQSANIQSCIKFVARCFMTGMSRGELPRVKAALEAAVRSLRAENKVAIEASQGTKRVETATGGRTKISGSPHVEPSAPLERSKAKQIPAQGSGESKSRYGSIIFESTSKAPHPMQNAAPVLPTQSKITPKQSSASHLLDSPAKDKEDLRDAEIQARVAEAHKAVAARTRCTEASAIASAIARAEQTIKTCDANMKAAKQVADAQRHFSAERPGNESFLALWTQRYEEARAQRQRAREVRDAKVRQRKEWEESMRETCQGQEDGQVGRVQAGADQSGTKGGADAEVNAEAVSDQSSASSESEREPGIFIKDVSKLHLVSTPITTTTSNPDPPSSPKPSSAQLTHPGRCDCARGYSTCTACPPRQILPQDVRSGGQGPSTSTATSTATKALNAGGCRNRKNKLGSAWSGGSGEDEDGDGSVDKDNYDDESVDEFEFNDASGREDEQEQDKEKEKETINSERHGKQTETGKEWQTVEVVESEIVMPRRQSPVSTADGIGLKEPRPMPGGFF